jgi:hypothetical protein
MPKRPNFTPAIARRICDLISGGASLDKISALPGMPSRRTVCRWMEENPDFERQYEIARRQRTDALVDEAIEIADSVRGETENAAVQAARLAVDTRRWLASKLLPERFGDRAAVELTGRDGSPLHPPPEAVDPRRIALALHAIVAGALPPPVVEHQPAPERADAWRGALPNPGATLTTGLPDPEPPPIEQMSEAQLREEARILERRRARPLHALQRDTAVVPFRRGS